MVAAPDRRMADRTSNLLGDVFLTLNDDDGGGQDDDLAQFAPAPEPEPAPEPALKKKTSRKPKRKRPAMPKTDEAPAVLTGAARRPLTVSVGVPGPVDLALAQRWDSNSESFTDLLVAALRQQGPPDPAVTAAYGEQRRRSRGSRSTQRMLRIAAGHLEELDAWASAAQLSRSAAVSWLLSQHLGVDGG